MDKIVGSSSDTEKVDLMVVDGDDLEDILGTAAGDDLSYVNKIDDQSQTKTIKLSNTGGHVMSHRKKITESLNENLLGRLEDVTGSARTSDDQ